MSDLPVRVRDPDTGVRLGLSRAWPRSPTHLLLAYADPAGRAVAGQWFADPEQLATVAARTPAPALPVPEAGVLLQPAGADRRLPALAELVARPGAALLSHRPERRGVVRGGGSITTYVKVVRAGRGAAVLAAAERAEAVTGLQVPAVLGLDEARSAVEFAELPGRTALELGRDGTPAQVRAAWTAIAGTVRLLHDGPTEGVAAHDAAAEVAVTRGWLELAAAYGLLVPDRTEAVLAKLLAGPPGPAGLLHRDLHDKQLIVDPRGQVGMLDVDNLALGERALDIANVLAHLRLREMQRLLTPARAELARAAFLAGLAADPDTVRRVPAYERVSLLRLAAVYAFRPRWAEVARDLLRTALAP